MGASSSLPAQDNYTAIVEGSGDADAGLGPIHRCPQSKDRLMTHVHDDAKTLYEIFQRGLRLSTNKPCMGFRPISAEGKPGPYTWMTYAEIWAKCQAIGSGFINKNLFPPTEDEEALRLVGLYCKNRYEWVVVEQACNAYGGVIVPLYDTLGESAVTFILNQTTMATVCCGSHEYPMLLAAKRDHPEQLTHFKNVVQFEDVTEEDRKIAAEAGLQLLSFAEVLECGKADLKPVTPPEIDAVATFCYTSGTTGDPKGVMLTHGNIVADLTGAVVAGVVIASDDRHLSYLPLAHMFERLVQATCWMGGAAVGFYQGEPTKIMEDLQALRPTIFPSVPRLYNKIYDKITNGVKAAGGLKASLFNKGYESKLYYLKRGHLEHGMWDKLVFGKVKARLGLDRVRIMITGSAPISAHVMDFLRIVFACHVIEGYGQTETSAGATVTPLNDQASAGHVGVPIACNEIRLVSVPDMGYHVTDTHHGEAESKFECVGRGEIQYRGPNIFKGYYKNPAKTAEALVEGGWLASGDIGVWLPNGYLKIVDRKKNIFKLAQGEYIAAEKIENVYIGSSFVAQAFVYGDSLQSCLVAIIVPDVDFLMGYAADNNIGATAPAGGAAASEEAKAEFMAAVCKNEGLKATIFADLKAQAKARKLRGFENAKAIHLEPELWSVDNEMLTPTFKLKRNVAKKHYQTIIDGLYAGLGSLGTVAGKTGLKQGSADHK